MRTENIQNFITLYRDVYPEGYCEHLISEFNRLESESVGGNRQQTENTDKHIKDDYSIVLNPRNHNLFPFGDDDPVKIFFGGLQDCYDEYSKTYSILHANGNLRATAMKMQKTGPGGGYHVWHAEQGVGPNANRAIVYSLYLNDVESGGETEFLYQRLRIKAEKNMMVFWPAAYTHPHRGNPVLSDTYKYIVTGWFFYD